jgi:hypothetical protein
MTAQQVPNGDEQTGSLQGNQLAASSETPTAREIELERRRATLQSIADRTKQEKDALAQQLADERAANAALRGQVSAASTTAPAPASQPGAPGGIELAELRVRLARSERRDAIEDFLAKPENADVSALRHMIPQTMDISELPKWATDLRSLGPTIARGAANTIAGQVVRGGAVPGVGLTSGAGSLLPAAMNDVGGYVPPQVANAGGPAAIIVGGAGSDVSGAPTVTQEEIDAAFKDIKPGDHDSIWATVGNLFKKIPLPQNKR